VCAAGHTLCSNGSSTCVADIQPGSQVEICDAKDNDCDGQTDEMNATVACQSQNPGAQFVQSWSCGGGTCGIAVCNSGHADINGAPADGCECTTDSYSNSCATAGTVSVPIGGTVNIVGKVETASGSDWLTVQFTNKAVGEDFHPQVQLVDTAGGQYAMDIRTSCATIATCEGGENGSNVTVWEQHYDGYTPGAGCCSDNTPHQTSVIVRVYRKFANTPTCASYTVTATNP
jgi:hypothetical protein